MNESKSKVIGAMMQVRKIPREKFGTGRARQLRILVLQTIASYANANGENAYPSLVTIADKCGASIRGVTKAIKWLRENGLLEVTYKGFATGWRSIRFCSDGNQPQAERFGAFGAAWKRTVVFQRRADKKEANVLMELAFQLIDIKNG